MAFEILDSSGVVPAVMQAVEGTLAGYEVREYLLEKWGRQCAYCGAKDMPLQIEHIRPRASGRARCGRICWRAGAISASGMPSVIRATLKPAGAARNRPSGASALISSSTSGSRC